MNSNVTSSGSGADADRTEKTDAHFMRAAIRLARKAAAVGDVPIGCVIVKDGRIIARGYNKRTLKGNVLCHAELIAINKACRALGDWRLEECTMYVTLEPCPMCAGAIVQARIPRVVIGCMNPKAGCAGSVLDLLHESGFNHQVETTCNVLQPECSALMKDFFRALRRQQAAKKKAEETADRSGGNSKPDDNGQVSGLL